ncbi:DUF7010 family protein [Massilia sp. DD77]|uniref:DUF7010 family protein n=1 Tax=Massilia sp. DD77 TaxID=3109349 RepID=UPI002FFFF033
MEQTTTFADAQRDMRHAYAGGAPGMLVSSLVWMGAGLVAMTGTAQNAVLALFVGGMLIHPLGMLLARLLGRPGNHAKGNPLGSLALESTVWMLLGFALAYSLSQWRSELFFPAMLLTIGGRYLSFATVYGMRIYWACGAALAAAGFLLAGKGAPMANSAFAGAAIELVFAVAIFARERSALRRALPQ